MVRRPYSPTQQLPTLTEHPVLPVLAQLLLHLNVLLGVAGSSVMAGRPIRA